MYCSLERGLTNLTIFSFVLETKQMNIFVQEAKIFCVIRLQPAHVWYYVYYSYSYCFEAVGYQ